MHWRSILFFLVGLSLGSAPWIYKNWHSLQTYSLEEQAVAQRLYYDLECYSDPQQIKNVLNHLNQLLAKKADLLPYTQTLEILTKLGMRKGQESLHKNLEQANEYLQILSTKSSIQEVVKGYVYVETLKQGSGDSISEGDTVLIHFKEFSKTGELLKDTTRDSPYKIPLFQTIRGFKAGLIGAKPGEVRKVYIHPEWGFGALGISGGNRVLIYEITVLEKVPPLSNTLT